MMSDVGRDILGMLCYVILPLGFYTDSSALKTVQLLTVQLVGIVLLLLLSRAQIWIIQSHEGNICVVNNIILKTISIFATLHDLL
jgi:hypothetical protein